MTLRKKTRKNNPKNSIRDETWPKPQIKNTVAMILAIDMEKQLKGSIEMV